MSDGWRELRASAARGNAHCACFAGLVMVLFWALSYVLMPYELYLEHELAYWLTPFAILAWSVTVYVGLQAVQTMLSRRRPGG